MQPHRRSAGLARVSRLDLSPRDVFDRRSRDSKTDVVYRDPLPIIVVDRDARDVVDAAHPLETIN